MNNKKFAQLEGRLKKLAGPQPGDLDFESRKQRSWPRSQLAPGLERSGLFSDLEYDRFAHACVQLISDTLRGDQASQWPLDKDLFLQMAPNDFQMKERKIFNMFFKLLRRAIPATLDGLYSAKIARINNDIEESLNRKELAVRKLREKISASGCSTREAEKIVELVLLVLEPAIAEVMNQSHHT